MSATDLGGIKQCFCMSGKTAKVQQLLPKQSLWSKMEVEPRTNGYRGGMNPWSMMTNFKLLIHPGMSYFYDLTPLAPPKKGFIYRIVYTTTQCHRKKYYLLSVLFCHCNLPRFHWHIGPCDGKSELKNSSLADFVLSEEAILINSPFRGSANLG